MPIQSTVQQLKRSTNYGRKTVISVYNRLQRMDKYDGLTTLLEQNGHHQQKIEPMKESKAVHFYCQKLCGDANFSINEWNRQFEICNAAGIEMPEDDLEGCKEQCFDCLAIVGETRLKNKK